MSTPLHLILLAGGKGERAAGGDGVPKQFRATGQGALFAVSLRTFLGAEASGRWHLASVTVTAPTDWQAEVEQELASLSVPCHAVPCHVAAPGASRTASTWSATKLVATEVGPEPGDLVAVHDAARPFATAKLLHALVVAALDSGGAIPGVPVPDTVVQVTAGTATYLQRERLLAVQTPQVFGWANFESAHRWAHETGQDFTDDGGLLAIRGHLPAVVSGEAGNWKVTSNTDWERAEGLLE
jgi:2-C-methyl-D-erythritol 4-phosphate cytidylyltransferase/2-C-methyl-D-erythritol 2,4-cyclodiphosphate synthase